MIWKEGRKEPLSENGSHDISSSFEILRILSPEPNQDVDPSRYREHASRSNKKGSCSMHTRRHASRLGAILSLLGGALVIYGICFLPMVIGNGGGSFTPHTEWEVAAFFFQYICGLAIAILAFPLVSVLLVGAMSVASFFSDLSAAMILWGRRVAIIGLLLQGGAGVPAIVLYTFGFDVGGGFWIVLLGFVVMVGGTFLHLRRHQRRGKPDGLLAPL